MIFRRAKRAENSRLGGNGNKSTVSLTTCRGENAPGPYSAVPSPIPHSDRAQQSKSITDLGKVERFARVGPRSIAAPAYQRSVQL